MNHIRVARWPGSPWPRARSAPDPAAGVPVAPRERAQVARRRRAGALRPHRGGDGGALASGAQEPNFRYLTGLDQARSDSAVVAGPRDSVPAGAQSGSGKSNTGRQPAAGDPDIRARHRDSRMSCREQFESQLAKALEASPSIATLLREPYVARLKEPRAAARTERRGEQAGAAQGEEVGGRDRGRSGEARDVGVAAHLLAAWKRIAPGLF